MFTKINAPLLAVIGILLFNLLFWEEKMGLNTLLFTLFLVYGFKSLYPDCWQKREVMISGTGSLIAAVMVVFINSGMAKFTYWVSIFAFAGFVQQRQLRHFFYAFLLSLSNAFIAPYTLVKEVFFSPPHRLIKQTHKAAFNLRLLVIPAIVLPLFYLLYYFANPNFANLSSQFWEKLFSQFSWNLSLQQTLFILLSVVICGGLIMTTPIRFFIRKQLEKSYVLRRVKKVETMFLRNHSMIALNWEYKSGIILLVSLNLLLLIVNIIDVSNVWLQSAPKNPYALMNYVHEGTYLLILAILLAMGVILYFFRKNLNFLADNEFLRHLSYLWLAQNAILAFSVGIRNYKYIQHCGLAYKRIGVILFLLLSIYGLYTMFIKVEKKRTFHFLIHRNTWALYFLLLFSSLFNWDGLITRYNLHANTPTGIDARFLIEEVSDKNIKLLENHLSILKERNTNMRPKWIEKGIRAKRQGFEAEQSNLSWRSWNLIDWLNRSPASPVLSQR